MKYPNDFINKVIQGDCLEILKSIPDNKIDTVITDPPYALEFMGKGWDQVLPSIDIWKECLRVAKPGATLLSFGGTRTYHRLACMIEDAGWLIKDCIMWLHGQGFPKATDISKQLDKKAGKEREIIRKKQHAKKDFKDNLYAQDPANANNNKVFGYGEENITIPTTPEAKLWSGYKSHGLKPAYEPIIVAMKPNEGSYADNAIKWGCAGINVDGGRIDYKNEKPNLGGRSNAKMGFKEGGWKIKGRLSEHDGKGRYPSNTILQCTCKEVISEPTETKEPEEVKGGIWQKSEGKPAGRMYKGGRQIHTNPNCPCYMLDEQSGVTVSSGGRSGHTKAYQGGYKQEYYGKIKPGKGDKGGASRFFKSIPLDSRMIYCPKASKRERNMGCEEVLTWENVALNSEMEQLNLLKRDISEGILQNMENLKWSTMLFGSEPKEKFQKDIVFIIKITLKLITDLKISKFSPCLSIKDCTLDALKMLTDNGINLVESVENMEKLKKITTNEKMAILLGVSLAVLKMLSKIKERGRKGNMHNTVKPLKLMEYLCTLTKTPTGGIVLDPFAGSGTTCIACKNTGRDYIGIEKEKEYCEIARARLNAVKDNQLELDI